ncbi:MAG TPA: EamA family transporter RarD [Caulobacteraceae bacterium]|nr:EamA family transporter RarD [Caulobacteraceae bacterium]
MTPTAAAPGGQDRRALAAGLGCYLIWGASPGLFILMDRAGASPWEIVGQRALWSPLWAAGLVIAAGLGREALGVLARPRTLATLLASGALIGSNWAVYIWAVNNGHNIDSSLGYFINPLLNMAVGGLLFRERIDAVAWMAIALAAIGVVLQTVALGHLPVISLFLAVSFCTYGVIRKRVAVEAQTGLLVECLLIAVPGIASTWAGSTGAVAGPLGARSRPACCCCWPARSPLRRWRSSPGRRGGCRSRRSGSCSTSARRWASSPALRPARR